MDLSILLSWTAFVGGALLITIIRHRARGTPAILLALFLLTLTTYSFSLFLLESKNVVNPGILLKTCTILTFLMAPSMYLYVVSSTRKNWTLNWKALVHILPLILLLADYLPLLFRDTTASTETPLPLQGGTPFKFMTDGAIFPAGSHYLIRHLLALGYVVLTARMLIGSNHSIQPVQPTIQHFNWLRVLVSIFAFFTIGGIAAYFFPGSSIASAIAFREPLMILLTVSIVLIFHSHVLQGSPASNIRPVEPGKRLVVPDAIYEQVHQQLQIFIDHKEFLRKQLKLREVAEELGVQPYILSAYINKVYKMRFNDLINWHRIEYIKEELQNNKWKTHTLEAMAKNGGFSNRTTFLISFKKFTGLTPTAFLNFTDSRLVDEV